MKIGIISMQRVPNYGSYLQAAGLKSILNKLGHEVVFLDYKTGKPAVPYSSKRAIIYRIKSLPIIYFLNDFVKYQLLRKRNFDYKYRLVYLKELGISYHYNCRERVDAAVIGSDEVFNCLQAGFNVGFSPMLFGQGINTERVISYAASFGYTSIEGMKQAKVDKIVAKYLQSFEAISVRDENSKEIVTKLIGKVPEINLDPVLIADYDLPNVKPKYSDYIVLYTYKSRDYSDEDIKYIKELCKKHKKTLLSLGNSQPWVDVKLDVSPLEMLVYIKEADFIITDTFHGSVFSIKYNKRFATLVRKDNRNKLEDLLLRVKKENRIINSFKDLDHVYQESIDYGETNEIIEFEKQHTFAYLSKALEH